MNTASLGKQIAAESLGSGDVLSPFDRDVIGADAVRLNLPLRDPVECRRHLALLEDTAHRLRMLLEERKPDRSLLFMVRGELRQLNRKLNAYRTSRRD